ncbi:LysM domain-containing protein [Motilibacter peucedani]|uniref:LysM domain-containing protein n=1 Tax=Motilibacter peucedani TaxID=598650 RepID=A0A420XPE6_9ACTN|nr:transglycosylase SLT domain-containing protein [Motilibacter peucedani]RKS74081.1 LysM domain-containing protein [Motilibacter peucedani]
MSQAPHTDAPRTGTRSWRRALGVAALPLLLAGLVTAGTPGWQSILVHRGDTLSEIAKRYHTSVSRLVRANDLPGNGSTIYAGERLRVPTAAAQAKIARSRAKAKPKASASRRSTTSRSATRTVRRTTYRTVYVSYTVRSGDSLIRIGRHFGARTSGIRLANHLPVSGVVRIGQHLRIPVVKRTTTSHTVKAPVRVSSKKTSKPTKNNTFAGRTYPNATVQRAAANRSVLARRSMPTRTQMRSIISATARANGVSPSLALAVAYQESGFNPRVVSVANAIGAMQVMPATGEWASSVIGRRLDLLNPRDNATAGVVLLRILTRTASSTEQAVAGYYQGLASVRKNGMYSDTKRYVSNVMSLRRSF